MKLTNVKIGTQLRLGLGAIFSFVLLLGYLAWNQSNLLWVQTREMYDHPLQVRRALGALEADILTMRLEFKNMIVAQDDQERQTARQNSAVSEADAEQQFDILYDHYLGPRLDIDEARKAFARWVSLRESNRGLIQAGKIAEALSRSSESGDVGVQRTQMFALIKKIDDFARSKGDQFYQTAMEQKDLLNRQLAVGTVAILLLSLTVFYLLLRGVKDPLLQLTRVAEHFRAGKMDARSRYLSANEFGGLSATFNAMADRIETQRKIEGQAAQLAKVMIQETEAHAFCRELLKALTLHTGSQLGAIYLLNHEHTEFELFESIGLTANARASFSAVSPEGEFGAALATGRMQRINDIPAETRFTFAAVSGEFAPSDIVTLPLLTGEETVAVISLASVSGYEPNAIRLLEEVVDTLTASVNRMLAFRQVQELAARLEQHNVELDMQKQELSAQSQELTHQNTELAMQQKQLAEANRLKSAFLSNMSHELRTPLNSVIALSGVLSRRLTAAIPEEEFGYLEVIERNGRHLLSLINDILDLSRIEAGREEISLGQFSMRALVGEVVAMIEPQAREKEIALENRVDCDLPLVTSDAGKVRHILQNLVANAVKFIEAGSVLVSARRIEDELHIDVRDTGIGIAANKLDQIFDEFRQADDSTSRKYGGSGLGLAIARKYATLLRGALSVESTPGQGSTFTLRLPLTLSLPGVSPAAALTSGNDSARATVRPWPGVVAAGRGQRILLVEDNTPAVIQMTDILSGQGYQVQVARGGKEALAQIDQALPDAVILDLMMPEMDGFEVLRQLREKENSFRLPVLILTAKHVTKEELSVLKGNNIHQLIQKGDVSKPELLAAVARMVAPPAEKPLPPKRRRTRKPRQGKPLILVVEDNPDNLRTARALLKDAYAIIEAEDGQAAIEQARQHLPDCILMDLALPVIDGFTALALIREDEALQDIPVVVVTASAMKGDREEILAHGFDGYISKPIDSELLQKTLREVLDGDE